MTDTKRRALVCYAALFAGCGSYVDVLSPTESSLQRDEGDAATSSDAYVDVDVPDAGLAPNWLACAQSGPLFQAGRTGDSCSFEGHACGTTSDCGLRTAACLRHALTMTELDAHDCQPGGVFATSSAAEQVTSCNAAFSGMTGQLCDASRTCARVQEGSCCVEFAFCVGLDDGSAVLRQARVCNGCEALTWSSGSVITGCDALEHSTPVAGGQPCQGTFVCNSLGQDFQLDGQPGQPFDSYGTIYWCDGGRLQRGVLGLGLTSVLAH